MDKIVFYFPYDKSYQDLVNETFEKATGKPFDSATEDERFESSNQSSAQFLAEIDKLDFLSKTNIFQHLMNEYFNLSEPVGTKIEMFLANPVFTESRELMTHCSIQDGEEDIERGALVDYNENVSYVLLPSMPDNEIENWIKEFEKNN